MPFKFITDEGESQIGEKKEPSISKIRSVISSPIKGLIKEGREQLFKLPFLGEELKHQSETNSPLVASEKEFQSKIEKYLPTRNEFTEKALEKGSRIAPYVAIGGGGIASSLARSLGAGFAGEGIKKSGGNEFVQALGELFSLGLPSFSKNILSTKAQKPLVDFARKMGLSESEIAPLIQGEKKGTLLGKISPKRGKIQKRLQKSKEAVGGIYEKLKSSHEGSKTLSNQNGAQFLKSLYNEMSNLPSSLRDIIMKDFMDLRKGGFSGKNLINFYQDINHEMGKGLKKLGGVQNSVKEAINKISPKLSKEFHLTNELYKNRLKLSSKLKPTLFNDLMKFGRAGRIALGIFTGNIPIIAESLAETAGKLSAREMLTNSRFQNLGKQMLNSLNQGKIGVAKNISEKINQILNESEKNKKEITFIIQ